MTGTRPPSAGEAHAKAAAAKSGRPNQDRAREQREARASIAPSAARVLYQVDDGWRSVDPVALALAFARDLLGLQGSGSDEARQRAGGVHRAMLAGETVPSGLGLGEVLDVDVEALPRQHHDGAVVVAEALAAVGRRHDAGEVDLYARVAPLGVDRHPHADEVDLVCSAVLPEDDVDADLRPRLVVTAADGWLEVWPPAALRAASLGVLAGGPADAVGEGLYRWLVDHDVDRGMTDRLRALVGDVDLPFLVQTAAARAGSDHAALAGPVLLSMLAPPAGDLPSG